MSHHSNQPLDPELDRMLKEKQGKLVKKFPDDQILGPGDEGAINMAIGTTGTGLVTLAFPKSVMWIAMTPEGAVTLAQALIDKARKVARGVLEVKL